MNTIKNFIRKNLPDYEKHIGPVSILVVDLSVSFNLLVDDRRPPYPACPYSYGVTIEPFQFHLMGKDGDVTWSSTPLFNVTNWIYQYDEKI